MKLEWVATLVEMFAGASFFAKNMLPMLTSTRSILDNLDNEIMELDEAAF